MLDSCQRLAEGSSMYAAASPGIADVVVSDCMVLSHLCVMAVPLESCGGAVSDVAWVLAQVRDSLGLTYDVSFELSLFDRMRLGWFVIHVTSTPAKIQAALSACIDVLRSFHRQPVSERELLRAKRTLLTRHESDLKVILCTCQLYATICTLLAQHMGFELPCHEWLSFIWVAKSHGGTPLEVLGC